MKMAKRYVVQHSKFDAARPWAVVATFRSFNKVIGRYSTKAVATSIARKRETIDRMKPASVA